jgi:hypothetical protein
MARHLFAKGLHAGKTTPAQLKNIERFKAATQFAKAQILLPEKLVFFIKTWPGLENFRLPMWPR